MLEPTNSSTTMSTEATPQTPPRPPKIDGARRSSYKALPPIPPLDTSTPKFVFPTLSFAFTDDDEAVHDPQTYQQNGDQEDFETILSEVIPTIQSIRHPRQIDDDERLFTIVLSCKTKHTTHEDETRTSKKEKEEDQNNDIPLTVFRDEIRIEVSRRALFTIPFFYNRCHNSDALIIEFR
mgnify:FL=1